MRLIRTAATGFAVRRRLRREPSAGIRRSGAIRQEIREAGAGHLRPGQALDGFTVKTLLGRAGVERDLRPEGHGRCA